VADAVDFIPEHVEQVADGREGDRADVGQAAPAGSAPETRANVIDLDRLSVADLRELERMAEVARVGGVRPGTETIDLDRCTDEELDVLERIADRGRADREAAAGRRELTAVGAADLCARPPAC